MGFRSGNVLPKEFDGTPVGRKAARDDVKQGGFTSTVGPNDGFELSLANLKRQVIQDRQVPESLGDVVDSK